MHLTLSKTIINRLLVSLLTGGMYLAATTTIADDSAAKSVALLNFYDRQDQVHVDGEKLEMLIFAKLAECNNVRMIERKSIDKIMAERKITANGMTSGKQSLQLGTMLGADFILTGRIYSMDGSVYFSAKLINCRNANVSGIVASYPESMKKEEMLEAFAGKAAAQIQTIVEAKKNGK